MGAILSTAPATRRDEKLRVCLGCHFTGYPISVVAARVAISRYACVAVIAAKMLGGAVSINRFVVTCQPLPISVIYLNGGRQEDTILSGLCRWQVATLRSQESSLSPVSGAVY